MDENEMIVVGEITENVDTQTTEENVEEAVKEVAEKSYTQAEVDDLIQTRLARQERKLKKDYEKELRKYREAEDVLNQGLGTSGIEEATDNLKNFYKDKGIDIKDYNPVDDIDVNILADYDAKQTINVGYDEVVDELNKMSAIGFNNMTPREKAVFKKLADYRQEQEEDNELRAMGISDKDEFKEFSKKLNSELSLKEKYEMYESMKPKKEINNIGSLKSGQTSLVKDYYTPDEVAMLDEDDLDKPGVYEAVRKSMFEWHK